MSHILFVMAEGALFNMDAFYGTRKNSMEERYDKVLDLIESKFPLNIDPDVRISYRDKYLSGISGKLVEGERINPLTMIGADFATILHHAKSEGTATKELEKEPKHRIAHQLGQLRQKFQQHEPMLTKGGYMFSQYTQLQWPDVCDAFRESARHTPSFAPGFAKFNLFKDNKFDVRLVVLTEGNPEHIRTYLEDRKYTEDMMPDIQHIVHGARGKLDQDHLKEICRSYAEQQHEGECQIFVGSDYGRHIKVANKVGLVPVYMSDDQRVVCEFDANYEGYQIQNYHSMDAVLRDALSPEAAAKACHNQWTKGRKGDTTPFQQKLI